MARQRMRAVIGGWYVSCHPKLEKRRDTPTWRELIYTTRPFFALRIFPSHFAKMVKISLCEIVIGGCQVDRALKNFFCFVVLPRFQ